jgi:hypothetical protein
VNSNKITNKEKLKDAIKTNLYFYLSIASIGIIFGLYFIIRKEFTRYILYIFTILYIFQ